MIVSFYTSWRCVCRLRQINLSGSSGVVFVLLLNGMCSGKEEEKLGRRGVGGGRLLPLACPPGGARRRDVCD